MRYEIATIILWSVITDWLLDLNTDAARSLERPRTAATYRFGIDGRARRRAVDEIFRTPRWRFAQGWGRLRRRSGSGDQKSSKMAVVQTMHGRQFCGMAPATPEHTQLRPELP